MKKRIVFIGGGPAGYEGAIRVTQLGAEVIVIEKLLWVVLALTKVAYLQRLCTKTPKS